jgi:uncharacterized protein (TIGR03435 family)
MIAVTILVTPLSAQPNPTKPEFETASVRLSAPGARGLYMKGGPGTDDPGRVAIENYPLESLILTAYDLQTFEINGPSWLIGNFGPESVKVDIVATMPPDTTKHQFDLMLQHVLEERFNLVMHVEKKEMPIYTLGLGRKSPKFLSPKTPGETSVNSPGALPGLSLGADGFPPLLSGRTMSVIGNRVRMHEPKVTMEHLAQLLSGQAGAPVKDMTGLQGEYDIDLFWGGNENDPDQITLEQAVQDQLGLRMSHSKGLADVFIVDHMDKVPTAN